MTQLHSTWVMNIILLLTLLLLNKGTISAPVEKIDCHNPTLVALDDNNLGAAWYQSECSSYGNLDPNALTEVYVTKCLDGNWLTPKKVSNSVKDAWNPVLTYTPNHELLLFYKVGDSPRQWVGLLSRSDNQGDTFSAPFVLPAGILGSTHSQVVYKDGLMLCPSSLEQGELTDQYRTVSGWIDVSPDFGKTWSKSGPIFSPANPYALIEPALYFDAHGNWHILARNRALKEQKDGYLYHSISTYDGKTWSPAVETNLPNPDSAIDILLLQDGSLLLAHHSKLRTKDTMILSQSHDEGKTWQQVATLQDGPGEVYYPSLAQTQNGHIHVLYGYTPVKDTSRSIIHAEFQ